MHETTEDPGSGLLQFAEPPPPPPTPPPPPDPKPPSCHSSPSPPRQRPQFLPRRQVCPPGQRGRGRGGRGALGRGQMFEDPAVMRIVQGRPTLKVMQIYLLCEIWGWTVYLLVLCLHYNLLFCFVRGLTVP